MKRCWNMSKKTRIEIMSGWGIFVILLGMGFLFSKKYSMGIYHPESIMLMFWIIFILYMGYYLIIDTLEKVSLYKVDETGIIVSYIPKKENKYTWDSISEISICDVYHANRIENFYVVIRVVIGEELNGPRNPKCKKNIYGYEEWRKQTYTYKNREKIILIEYSEEKYLEIKKISGKEIKDYRKEYSAREIKLP